MPGNIPHPSPKEISDWQPPNYVDPVRQLWLPGFSITLHVLSSLLVILRLGLRFAKKGGGWGLDDALIGPSWIFATAFTIMAILASNSGFTGIHIKDVKPKKLEAYALNTWLAELFFVLGAGCLKIAVLMFYRRLVHDTFNPKWRYAIWGAISFTAIFTVFLVFMLILNCSPPEAYWKAFDPTWDTAHRYHCITTFWINTLAGILSTISDVYAVILPIFMLWSLSITRQQKIGLFALFGAGLLVVGAACGRTYYFHEFTKDYDVTWNGFMVYVWSELEFELAIICACLPSVRLFYKEYLRHRFSSAAFNSHPVFPRPKSWPRNRSDNEEKADKFGILRSITVSTESQFQPQGHQEAPWKSFADAETRPVVPSSWLREEATFRGFAERGSSIGVLASKIPSSSHLTGQHSELEKGDVMASSFFVADAKHGWW